MKITRYPDEFMECRYGLMVQFTGQDDARNCGDLVVVMLNPATVIEDSDLAEGSCTRPRLIMFASEHWYGSMTEVNFN